MTDDARLPGSDAHTDLWSALEQGDLRVLLMTLVHMTGEQKWLEDPYLPARDVRLIADKGAGLPRDIAARIRAAVFDALTKGDAAAVIDRPTDELFRRMMSVCLGEEVDSDYVPMMLAEMGFPGASANPAGRELSGEQDVLIIGAGVSGICAAIKLAEAGVPFRVLEKDESVGGTWWENTYPNCGVDTPNQFYSYSFAPSNEWSRHFSLRDEIYEYLRTCVRRFGILDRITLGADVRSCVWNADAGRWGVSFRTGDGALHQASAQHLITAVGQLNVPSCPVIPGLESFPGKVFHSARWPDDLDVTGLRVGVVGAGASAMQLVPAVAEKAGSTVIYQRSPQWIRRIDEYRELVSDGEKSLLSTVPYYRAWTRFALAWRYGDSLHRHLQIDPSWTHPERSMNRGNERHRLELVDYIETTLAARPDLIAKVTPDYPPYAKRMLMDAGWYAALKRPDVELITETLRSVDGSTVVATDGSRRDLDVLVLATGFTATHLLSSVDVVGRGGHRLADRWGTDDPRAFLGITVPDFPNMYVMYGPNTNLAHGGSIIFHAECQMRYILSVLAQLDETGCDVAEVRRAVHDRYNDAVDEAHASMVWTHPGVRPWYRNAAGRVVSNSPWRLVDYWHLTRRADLGDYLLTEAKQPRRSSARHETSSLEAS